MIRKGIGRLERSIKEGCPVISYKVPDHNFYMSKIKQNRLIMQNQGNIFDLMKEKYYLCTRINKIIQVYDKRRNYRRSGKLHKWMIRERDW